MTSYSNIDVSKLDIVIQLQCGYTQSPKVYLVKDEAMKSNILRLKGATNIAGYYLIEHIPDRINSAARFLYNTYHGMSDNGVVEELPSGSVLAPSLFVILTLFKREHEETYHGMIGH